MHISFIDVFLFLYLQCLIVHMFTTVRLTGLDSTQVQHGFENSLNIQLFPPTSRQKEHYIFPWAVLLYQD